MRGDGSSQKILIDREGKFRSSFTERVSDKPVHSKQEASVVPGQCLRGPIYKLKGEYYSADKIKALVNILTVVLCSGSLVSGSRGLDGGLYR